MRAESPLAPVQTGDMVDTCSGTSWTGISSFTMPWKEMTMRQQREEFIALAKQEGVNRRELCRRFGISPTTAYKWLKRSDGTEHSRRPHHSPNKTPEAIEQAILAVRAEHPTWGARKIRRWLEAHGVGGLPAPSTITAILQRNGCIAPRPRAHRAWCRFEHAEPNALWQMDFKGHFALERGRCHPLVVLDDHSRYVLALQACAREDTPTVRQVLEATFQRYGLPEAILCDNGPPWGTAGSAVPWTPLRVWLCLLGVALVHGEPYHPQTQGKVERFHQTLKTEVLQGLWLGDLGACQQVFDRYRHVYNHQRPHEALGYAVPASRYRVSVRRYPAVLPEPEYSSEYAVRVVQQGGVVHFGGRELVVPSALRGNRVGVRYVGEAAVEVRFCGEIVGYYCLEEDGDV